MSSYSLRSIWTIALLLVSLSAAANVQLHDSTFVPDVVLRITTKKAAIACTYRDSVVVNGTTPGPLVTLESNKTTWIRVYNDNNDKNVTVHWHGLSQSVAPFSDGTPLASQWPIAPLHFFDYELHPTVNESGSYFYHSHVDFQTVSATGPLVVLEPQGTAPPYQYDDERIFFLSELYNRTDESIVDGLIAAPFVWSGETEAVLVNGQSQAVPNATDTNCAPEVFEVEPSKTYRFRFIGGMALADDILAIEDHPNITIIEADGSYTKPFTTDRLQVDSGQRFDILLKTKSEEELAAAGNNKTGFWIQIETRYRPTVTTGYALLRYKTSTGCCQGLSECYVPGTDRKQLPAISGTPPNLTYLLPPVGDNTTNTWLEYSLQPYFPNNFPSASEVTRRLYLTNVQIEQKDLAINYWINNHTWAADVFNTTDMTAPGSSPYLVDIYRNGQSSVPSIASANAYYAATKANGTNEMYTGWDPNFDAYPAAVGEVLEVILLNGAGFAGSFDVHPWHAHGGHYYDIGSGPGMYNQTANEAKLESLNKENGYVPALRDTTLLYRWPADNNVNDTEYTISAWRGWRIRVTDPGVWMIHCHTLQHMVMGMQTVWVMGNASEITHYTPPDETAYEAYNTSVEERRSVGGTGMEGYLDFKGAAYGNAERAPLVNHHFAT